MTGDESRADFPVLREGLPELRRDRPVHRAARPRHAGWLTIANQTLARGVAVGHDGSVWLATAGGVLRWWPGLMEFTRYGSEHGLPGNATRAIAVDAADRTWALSDRGRLSYRDGDAWRAYEPLVERAIGCIATDPTGRLWAVAADAAWEIDDPAGPPGALPTGPAGAWQIVAPRALAAGGPGDLWVASAAGVSLHDGAGWRAPQPPRDVLALARQGESLWLGAATGLRCIDLATGKGARHESWPQGPVAALAAGTDGVWAACEGQIGYATAAGWQPLPNLQLRAAVTGLASAGAGSVWIASHDGLWRGGPAGVRLCSTEAPPELIESLRPDRPNETFSNLVQALAFTQIDGRPALWIGAPRGLVYVDLLNNLWRGQPLAALRDVRALAAGSAAAPGAEMWAASWSGGPRRLLSRGALAPQVASPGIVLGLNTGPAGLWAAVGLDLKAAAEPGQPSDGVYRWAGGEWALALPAGRLKLRELGLKEAEATLVQAVAEDAGGRLWLGTPSGLFSWQPGDPAPAGPDASLGGRDVRCLLALSNGELCVGTTTGVFAGAAGGLAVLSRPEGAAAWPGGAVTGLAWDPADQVVWCGTDAGLIRGARGPAGWQIEAIYTAEEHGLAANHVTALALGVDGTGSQCLWIGTPAGLGCLRL